jgi:hypothetical protein
MPFQKSNQIHEIVVGEKELKVGRGHPLQLSTETDKKNPNSLRFVVGHLINFYFGGSRSKAVEAMEKVSGTYASDRPTNEVKLMNSDALAVFLGDQDHVEYWHLEAIAKSVNIPSGALLALSRVYSLVRDGNVDAATAYAEGLRVLAAQLESMARTQTISRKQVDEIVSGFEKTLNLETSPKLWSGKTL